MPTCISTPFPSRPAFRRCVCRTRRYAPLVNMLLKKLTGQRGAAARAVVTTIGLGSQLDSELLAALSDQFLHMPDPGSVGPFMVNMLAAQRCTARVPEAGGKAANHASLLLSPAAAVRTVPGFSGTPRCVAAQGPDGAPALRLTLGAMCYDQVRHIVVETTEGAAVGATLELHEQPVAQVMPPPHPLPSHPPPPSTRLDTPAHSLTHLTSAFFHPRLL